MMNSRKHIRICAALIALALQGLAVAPACAANQANAQRGFTLAFVDADVKRVVDAIVGSMLGANYDLDPDLKGNITLRTASPVSADELIPLLEAAIAPLDAVIIDNGSNYRILSRAKARTLSPILSSGGANVTAPRADFEPSSLGFASEAIALQYASARNIAELATELLGKDIISVSSGGRNEVIVTGSASERDAAKKLIARFDVDSLAAMNFQIWKLEDVDAQTLVDELDEIFSPPFDIIGTRVRLVPLPRLGSVLGIAADNADLNRIEPWIKRLDNGGSGKRKLYSYSVQNGRARDIANSLQLVLGGTSSQQTESQNTAPVNVRGNETIGGGNDGQNSSASERVSSQSGFPNVAANTGSAGGGDLRIVPNDQNNSLLIYANGEEYGFIRDALEKLDKPVAQVLIEATLAEVTLSDDLSFGIDFQTLGRSGSADVNVTNSSTSGAVPASSFPGTSISLIGTSVNAVLNTLQSKTNVKVLSAPKLLMLNNETATLQVGDQVPIVTQQAQAVDTVGAPIVNSIELRDTGVILQVTPRVNDSGVITLDITQEVSDVATTTTSGINSPTIQQRRLTTTVATKSGQIIVLGGLIRDSQTRSKSGIPLLSQIPIVGGLFGRSVDTGSRTELVILITPTIIRSPDDVKNTVDALIDGLDLTRPLLDEAQIKQIGPLIEARRSTEQ